tara:strand:- start:157 stop:750 length:594 start_codon:yes stop_codon:yes gene_type:complete
MNMEDINKQIQENPLSKEEARKQFVEQTEKLGLKHSFSFDEAWEVGEILRKKQEYRDKIMELEEQLLEADGVVTGEELNKECPVKHLFADGCYIREIFNPAEQIIVTKIHKKTHPFFLVEGEMSILTEDGVNTIKAPHNGITQAGTKRVIYTHTDCRFITVHATDKTDIQEIEDEVIAKDFNDPEISLEDVKKLKNL